MKSALILWGVLLLLSCESQPERKPSPPVAPQTEAKPQTEPGAPHLTILGIAQDAGFPQADCLKSCCQRVWEDPRLEQKVVALGLTDPQSQQNWLLEATPDFPRQWQHLKQNGYPLAGILLTHAHIGHYTGLMYLGREAMGAQQIPVYTLPRMGNFLRENGPWSQLISLENISLREMRADSQFSLSSSLQIRPILVPHRDEFSETAGFLIQGPQALTLFIPDIDKWSKWEASILDWIRQVDYALLDGTFFANGEIPGRDMSEIPHPFVEESMALFDSLSPEDKAKVYFIHFNHTNPLLDPESAASQQLQAAGFPRVYEGLQLPL